MKPAGYSGLHALHKYWGKKPIEPLSFLIQHLTPETGIVLDPFLGGGLLTRLCLSLKRRFIGIDINPVATELGKLFADLPSRNDYDRTFASLERDVRSKIESSYLRSDKTIGSHYLWDGLDLESVWKTGNGRSRAEHGVQDFDRKQSKKFREYYPKNFREIAAFSNSRINATPKLSIRDIFKGRALANIDLLLESIVGIKSPSLRRAFLLTLTAASGQMSNFVFAINKRGKKKDEIDANSRTEVGSWAIGLWCPKRHFEVNVWNCFANRARKFSKAFCEADVVTSADPATSIAEFFDNNADCAIVRSAYQTVIAQAPDNSVDLILTDPPHSDRIPYLELSEFWNSLLQFGSADFEREIVISNASERRKNSAKYAEDMRVFMRDSLRVLKSSGYLCVLYNCTEKGDWGFLRNPEGLRFVGRFDLRYSAGSIVQDNRRGALKSDYALIYSPSEAASPPDVFKTLPGWSIEFPEI